MHAFAAAVAALALALGPAAAPAPAEQPPLHVYVVVLDGLRPSEVGALTPALSGLRDQGTWYEQARAVFPAETLPNHVAMMTGVRPERNGIVGNEFWHPNEGAESSFYMDDPSLLDADTLTTRLENACGAGISTATVQSKTYLHGVFSGEEPRAGDPNPQREADFHWAPPFYVPISEHAPDALTMDGFRTWVREQPSTLPRFAFVNLGDIDRSGHADVIGGATSGLETPARQTAIEDTDAQLGMLVDDLRESGAWDDTVLVLTSDHGMDWGPYEQQVEIEAALTAAGFRPDPTGAPPAGGSGDFNVVGGGGTGAVYAEDEADVPEMARVLDALPGVAFVATREPVPGLGNPTLHDAGMDHARNGDIVVFVEPHWRVGDGNPLPGNHGHPATQQSLLLVTGGHPLLRDSPSRVAGEPVFDPVRRPFSPVAGGPGNLSVAPTVAGLLGLGDPPGGYDGAPLSGAFEDYAFLPHRPCEAAGPPPDLAVSIADRPDPVRRNDVLTYTVAVDNAGKATATGVALRDALSDSVRFRSARSTQGTCTPSGHSVLCALGSLPPGARATVTIDVRADRPGTIVNRATASADEPEVDLGDNEAAETTTVLPTSG